MVRALHVGAINRRGKNSVHDLQYRKQEDAASERYLKKEIFAHSRPSACKEGLNGGSL